MDQRAFFNSQYPVFLVSRVMGLAPFSVKMALPAGEWVQLSVPWLIYSVALYGVYLASFAFCVEVSWRVPLARGYPFISIIGHMLQILLGLVIFNVCYILNFAKAAHFSRIGMRLSMIDVDLLKLASPCKELIDYKRALRLKWILFSSCVSFFLFMVVFDYFVFGDLYGNYMLLMCLAYILPYFSASVVMMQFMNMILVIQERLAVVNKFLQHIATVNESYTKQHEEHFTQFLAQELPSAAKVSPEQQQKREFLGQHFNPDLHVKLHEIFRVHDALCDLVEEVNDGYSFQMVTGITAIFIFLIFGLFFETKVVFWAWGGAVKLVLMSTSYLLWGIISTAMIYLVLFVCTRTRDTANRSALIIHKMLQMKPAFMLNDEVYYSKMKSFTLQVLHRKRLLHFNGLGLFRLDYTFIFSAVSAATSYLIVLLQFDLSNELQAFSSNKFY